MPLAAGDLVAGLKAVAVCRLVEVPRPAVGAERGAGPLQRDAAVVSAYHGAVAGDGVPLLAGWCRRAVGGRTASIQWTRRLADATRSFTVPQDWPLAFLSAPRGAAPDSSEHAQRQPTEP
jgi:hypothetical protein